MITYKDRTWCTFDACALHYPSKCARVMTDYDLKAIKEGDYLVSTFLEKPACYEVKED